MPAGGSGRSALLDQIQRGKRLKHVDAPEPPKPGAPAKAGAGGAAAGAPNGRPASGPGPGGGKGDIMSQILLEVGRRRASIKVDHADDSDEWVE